MKSMEETYDSEGYRKLGWFNFLGFYQRAIGSIIRNSVDIQDGNRILDAGCGYGLVSRAIENEIKANKIDIELYGFDISPSMPKAYRSFVSIPAELGCMDACNLSYEDNYFDTIICAGLFEHIENPEIVISEYMRCLKPNGQLLVVVSQKNALTQTMISFFGNATGSDYSEFKPFLAHSDITDVRRVYFRGFYIWGNVFSFVVRCQAK